MWHFYTVHIFYCNYLLYHATYSYCFSHTQDSYKNCASTLQQEIRGIWVDLLLTVLCDEWKMCKRGIHCGIWCWLLSWHVKCFEWCVCTMKFSACSNRGFISSERAQVHSLAITQVIFWWYIKNYCFFFGISCILKTVN